MKRYNTEGGAAEATRRCDEEGHTEKATISMKITRLKITQYRRFRAYTLQLRPGVNVLAGENGAGKSTILEAAGTVLSHMIARLKAETLTGRQIEQKEIHSSSNEASIEATIDPENGGEKLEFCTVATRLGLERTRERRYRDLSEWARGYRMRRLEGDAVVYPILAHYRVDRAVPDIPVRAKSEESEDPLSGYADALSGKGNFRQFFAWFRDQEDYEFEMQIRRGSHYEDPALQAVRFALKEVLPGIDNFHIRRRPRQAMYATKNGEDIEVSCLSDGERCYLALIGDIACRMAKLSRMRPLSAEQILKTPGIILVDELDLHLHPSWQREAIRKLPRVFPAVQFILTTHSPQMLGEVPADCVYLLRGDSTEPQHPKNTLGLSSSEILQLNMETNERDAQSLKIEQDVRDAIDAGHYHRAKMLLEQFRALTPNWAVLPLYSELSMEIEMLQSD